MSLFENDAVNKWKPDAPGEIECPLCGRKFSRLSFKLHLAFEKKQLLEIKADHPEWQEEGGACFPCINHYRAQFRLPLLSYDEAQPLFSITK